MAQTNLLEEHEVTDSRHEHHLGTDHLLPAIEGRTVRGGAISIVSNAVKLTIIILSTGIMARLLTPEDYGLVGMVAVFTSFASLFKDLGLSHAIVQISKVNHGQISTLFWINLGMSLATAVIIALMSPVVAWFYEEPRLTAITAVVAIGFLLGGLTVQHEALLRRQMRFFALSAVSLFSMFCGYAVGIVSALLGAGYWALIFAQLALLGSNALAVWVLCSWRPGLPRKNSSARNMLTLGGNVTGHTTINYFSGNMDHLMIGRVWGPEELGFYAKALQLLSMPTEQVNEPLASVTIPALSRLNDSPERYRQTYFRIMHKVLLLTMPCMAFMIATSESLVHLVLGPQWDATTRIFVFLGIAGLFQPVINTASWLLLSQGRGRHMLHWSILSAPLTVAFVFAGLSWGVVGVAASYSIGRLCLLYPLMFWFVGRTGPVRTRDFYRLLAPFCCAVVCVLLACTGFRWLVDLEHALANVAANLVITAIISLLALALIPSGRLVLRDIRNTLSMLVSRKPGLAPAAD
jgi:O-antigen/teichoic acid export membrane protein